MQHNATFPNARGSMRSAKLTCVKYANEPLWPRELSPNMEDLYNPWKVTSNGKGPQTSQKVGNQRVSKVWQREEADIMIRRKKSCKVTHKLQSK